MKYTGRLAVCFLSVFVTLISLIYQEVTGPAAMTFYEVLIFILILQPLFWWLGKQYDKSNYISEKLDLQQKELESLFNNSGAFLWTLDEQEKKFSVSKGIEDVIGFTSTEFEQDFNLWISRTYPKDEEKVSNHYNQLLSGNSSNSDWRVYRKDGDLRWLEVYGQPILNADGDVIKLNGVAYDVTERKQMEEKLESIAYYDSLTGLPNRRHFKLSAKQALARCRDHKQQLAIMFIDLDRFKFINDTMGHDTGDELLRNVSQRLRQSIRSQDIVARHGGDEFIILIEDIEESEVQEIAVRIINNFTSSFRLNGGQSYTTPSIGISLYPKDGDTLTTLIKHADDAMYLAKERGKNNFQFYIHKDKDLTDRQEKIEYELHNALTNNEFELHYQPKIDLVSGKTYGVEALLRWRHPELGMIPPSEFIPIAENTGVIKSIGEWVIQEACSQNKAWQESGLYVKMAVNVSSIQFNDDDFTDKISQALKQSQLSPEYLGIEITESVMSNLDRTRMMLYDLKKLGINVSIDDFGTGYSSLSVLGQLPIDLVKIDKSFIQDILTDANKASLVKTMITMAKDLDFELIAEGIEHEHQGKFLFDHGCHFGQGYLYSPPLPSKEAAHFLNQKLINA